MLHPNVLDVMKTLMATIQDPATPPQVVAWLDTLVEQLNETDTPGARFTKGYELPVGIGPKADEYSTVREARLAAEKYAEVIKKRETELYDSIMGALDESTESGGVGKLYSVQRVEKDRNNVEDWEKLHAYIQQSGDFNLLQKRLSDKAVNELLEDGKEVPGVKVTQVPTLSFRKVAS